MAVFLHQSEIEERCWGEAAGCLGDAWVGVPHGRQCCQGAGPRAGAGWAAPAARAALVHSRVGGWQRIPWNRSRRRYLACKGRATMVAGEPELSVLQAPAAGG